jgi:uncharacterized membrane protein
MDLYRTALLLHIATGGVALMSFWSAAVLTKGSLRHRRVGQVFLLAMLGVLASGVPLVNALIERGHPVTALFLGFLLLLTGQSSWIAWRAVRDRHEPSRFYGPLYWIFAALCGLGGAGIVALGIETGAVILQAFGGVGLVAAWGSFRSWQRWHAGRAPANWWLQEHYGAILGNGVATHIAFLGIGLRNALPFIEPQLRLQVAWLLPLVVAVVASAYLNRKYGRGVRRGRNGLETDSQVSTFASSQ